MNQLYHIEYEENEQTFADMYQMYYNNRSSYFYKLIITFGGLFFLVAQISVDMSVLSIIFFVKFLIKWALAYIAGYFFVKYVIRRIDAGSAQKIGKQSYEKRTEKFGMDLKVKIDFFEDNFTMSFQGEEKEYTYKEVSRLYKSERFYGIVVGGIYGKKAMVGFPAGSMDKATREQFGSFMAEKCRNVAGGFKKV